MKEMKEIKNIENYVETLEILKNELPKCFMRGDAKMPLALGIHKSLLVYFENDKRFDGELIQNAIRIYVKGTKYLRNVVFDVPRIDMNGKPVSKVTKAEQNYAEKILNSRKQKNQRTETIKRIF